MSLAYGLRTAPEDRPAWGARLIWPNDLVHDRQDMTGSDAERARLRGWLNDDGVLRAALAEARRQAKAYELRADENREVVLYEDRWGIVKANPQGSHGYLYVAAWLK
jgi:hypothetical protein